MNHKPRKIYKWSCFPQLVRALAAAGLLWELGNNVSNHSTFQSCRETPTIIYQSIHLVAMVPGKLLSLEGSGWVLFSGYCISNFSH